MPALAPDQVNSLLVNKLIQSLVVECTNVAQVVVHAGSRVGADDGSIVMEVPSNITVDITASGANGLDTGAEAADTWYYLWLIFNPTTEVVAGLLSTSPTSPTMPSGYTKKRLISAVRNVSTDFNAFLQRDNFVDANVRVLFTGIALPSASWYQTDASTLIPLSLSRTLIATTNLLHTTAVAVSAWGKAGTGASSSHEYRLCHVPDGILNDQLYDMYVRCLTDENGAISCYATNSNNTTGAVVAGYVLDLL